MADAIGATNVSEDLVSKVKIDMELAEWYFVTARDVYFYTKDSLSEEAKRAFLKQLVAMKLAMIEAGYYEFKHLRRNS